MGILNSAPPAPAPQAVPQPAPKAGQSAPKAGQPAPADKMTYQRVLLAATKIVYNKAMIKHLLDLVGKAQTPAIGLAQATILVMAKLAEGSRNSIPQNVKAPAGKAVLTLIAELAQKAGLIGNTPQAIQAASKVIAASIMRAAGVKSNQMPKFQPRIGVK